MKTAIIAEKPSVAREIAAIVGANQKENGFMTGNNYTVTWAFGHLVQLAFPEDYGFSGFVKENLPINCSDKKLFFNHCSKFLIVSNYLFIFVLQSNNDFLTVTNKKVCFTTYFLSICCFFC